MALKNRSVVKEANPEYSNKLEHKPSLKEQEVVTAVYNKFRDAETERNRSFEYFDGLTLVDYIDDSVRRFTTNVDERENIEDWQARIHDPFTRNKVMAVLAKVAKMMPIAEFKPRGDEDFRRAQILTSLYEYAEEVDDYEELMTFVLLESIVKGTVVGYEGHERKEKMTRFVTKQDDDIKIDEKKTVTSRLFGAIVPLEEFYPSSVAIRSVKQMPYCFRAKEMSYSKFCMDFPMYDKSKYVQAHKKIWPEGQQPFYADVISRNLTEGTVQVLWYYNQDVDEYTIIANGVWLNPVHHGKGETTAEAISPLPFNHKSLPFYDIKFDLFGSDFFYGKSMPDKLKSMQDVLNVLTNMLLDQSFLTIFPPILTNGFDPIEDDYLRPGRRTPIDTQGMSLKDSFMKLDLGTPSGWHQYILEYTRKIMEQSSMDQVSQGVAGVGERTTAQEIRVAAEGVASMLGLWGRQINYGIKRKATLKASNVMQFWTDSDNPMIRKILGDGGVEQFNDAFNTFTIKNTVLTDGKRGTKVIEMYKDKSKMPSKTKVKTREMILAKNTGVRTEIMAVASPYVQDFSFDTVLVTNPRSEAGRDIDKAMQLEKVRVYMSFFPDLVDREELAAQTAEKLGDDPTKVLKSELFNPPAPEQQQQGQNPMQDPGTPTKPTTNLAENNIKGMQGGMQSLNDLQALQQSMLG